MFLLRGIFLFFLLFFCSCQSNNPSEKRTSLNLAEDTLITQFSPFMKLIFKTDKGLIRGIEIGDSIANLPEQFQEARTLTDSSQFRTAYMIGLNPYEDCELVFLMDHHQRVKEVQLDAYLKSSAGVDSLFKDLKTYWTRKYQVTFQGSSSRMLASSGTLVFLIEKKNEAAILSLHATIGMPR
jgi:hypothetical protein